MALVFPSESAILASAQATCDFESQRAGRWICSGRGFGESTVAQKAAGLRESAQRGFDQLQAALPGLRAAGIEIIDWQALVDPWRVRLRLPDGETTDVHWFDFFHGPNTPPERRARERAEMRLPPLVPLADIARTFGRSRRRRRSPFRSAIAGGATMPEQRIRNRNRPGFDGFGNPLPGTVTNPLGQVVRTGLVGQRDLQPSFGPNPLGPTGAVPAVPLRPTPARLPGLETTRRGLPSANALSRVGAAFQGAGQSVLRHRIPSPDIQEANKQARLSGVGGTSVAFLNGSGALTGVGDFFGGVAEAATGIGQAVGAIGGAIGTTVQTIDALGNLNNNRPPPIVTSTGVVPSAALDGGTVLDALRTAVLGPVAPAVMNLDVPGIDVVRQGGAATLSSLTSPFRATMASSVPQLHVQTNPSTGAPTWFKPAGRPVLFSGDLTACKRVNKLARRAKRGGR